MALRSRSSRPWSWTQVRHRTLATYRAERDARERIAVLVWQADDPRVTVEGAQPPLLALTLDLAPEPGAANAIALAGFDSLERARAHCVDFAGAAAEVDWESLPETAQIGIYATIREPGFADRG